MQSKRVFSRRQQRKSQHIRSTRRVLLLKLLLALRTFDVVVVGLIDYGSDTQRVSVEMVVHCGEEAVVLLPYGLIADSVRVGACAQARAAVNISLMK